MSWFVDSSLTAFQRLCVNILKSGPIPHHIAFIMDGNRRYATKTQVQKAEGHLKGFEKLAETLQWCLELGIKEVTVYAFSIENFKRSPEEVSTLMRLATEKFQKLLDDRDRLMMEGICVRIIGNWGLLSPQLRKLFAEVTLLTKDNTKAILNVAFAYTSRDEITASAQCVAKGVQIGALDVEDIDQDLISDCLYSNKSPNPDILVRTSGEVRFSDFLLWQISKSSICFAEVLWPEFCIWHLLICIFKYQRCFPELERLRRDSDKRERSGKVQRFLERVETERLAQLETFLA